MRITRQSKRLTIFKINDTRVRQYSGYSPKGKLRETRSDPRRAKQRNLHHLVDYEEFSHVLVSINWWSSQKEKATHREHTTSKKGKLEWKNVLSYNGIPF